jgi:hypothetical protein
VPTAPCLHVMLMGGVSSPRDPVMLPVDCLLSNSSLISLPLRCAAVPQLSLVSTEVPVQSPGDHQVPGCLDLRRPVPKRETWEQQSLLHPCVRLVESYNTMPLPGWLHAPLVHRYPSVGGPSGPTHVDRTALAAATGGSGGALAVADVQRDPRVFVPAGGPPPVPPPTTSVTLALGMLNQRGTEGFNRAFMSAKGHTPFEMPTFPALLSK